MPLLSLLKISKQERNSLQQDGVRRQRKKGKRKGHSRARGGPRNGPASGFREDRHVASGPATARHCEHKPSVTNNRNQTGPGPAADTRPSSAWRLPHSRRRALQSNPCLESGSWKLLDTHRDSQMQRPSPPAPLTPPPPPGQLTCTETILHFSPKARRTPRLAPSSPDSPSPQVFTS